MDVDEQLASAERSIISASKHKIYGAFPKTLANLCKSIKAGRPHQDRLIEVTLEAIVGLDDESLLKAGSDLANLCALAQEKHTDCTSLIKLILVRVGRLDNDLVVFSLKDTTDLLIQTPKLLKQLVFDLVKFYFKPQAASVEKSLKTILQKAVTGSVDSCRAISEVITELYKDSTVEESSLSKLMVVCAGLQLHELVPMDDSHSTEVRIQLSVEKARLATWFNGSRANEKPSQTMLRLLAETDLVHKKV